jgi:hypothetical protein
MVSVRNVGKYSKTVKSLIRFAHVESLTKIISYVDINPLKYSCYYLIRLAVAFDSCKFELLSVMMLKIQVFFVFTSCGLANSCHSTRCNIPEDLTIQFKNSTILVMECVYRFRRIIMLISLSRMNHLVFVVVTCVFVVVGDKCSKHCDNDSKISVILMSV